MSVITQPRASVNRKPRPAHGLCSLHLSIRGQKYRVRPLPTALSKCYSLTKRDGVTYHVSQDCNSAGGRLRCTCHDFVSRREGIDPAGCKHLRALVVLGMLGEQPDPYGEPATPRAGIPRGPQPRATGHASAQYPNDETDGPGEPMQWATGGHSD